LSIKTDLAHEKKLIQTISEKINSSLTISELHELNDKFRFDKLRLFLTNSIKEIYPWKFYLNDTIFFPDQ